MATFYLIATLMILQGLLFSYDVSSSTTMTQMNAPTPSSIVVASTTGSIVTLTLSVRTNCSGGGLMALNNSLQNDTEAVYIAEGFPIKSVITQSISCNSSLNITLELSFDTGIPSGKTIEGVFQVALKDGNITSLTENNTIYTFSYESSSTMMTEMSTTPTQMTSTPSSSVVASTPDESSSTISTVHPSSSVVARTTGPIVILMFTITTNCSGDGLMALKASLQIDIKTVYVDETFPIKSVIIQSDNCTSHLNIVLQLSFYTGIPSGKTIKGVFEAALNDGKITNLTESNTIYTIAFTGVTLEYKPKDGQCQAVCCGAGGALTVERECTPTDKCEGIERDEKEEDGHCPGESKGTCPNTCDDEGSGGIHNSPSYALATLLAIASFTKTIFRF